MLNVYELLDISEKAFEEKHKDHLKRLFDSLEQVAKEGFFVMNWKLDGEDSLETEEDVISFQIYLTKQNFNVELIQDLNKLKISWC